MIESRSFSIHLWDYNHPFDGVSDQMEFLSAIFRQHGYVLTVGRDPCRESLNIVIENFDDKSREVLQSFCRKTGKRVAVIMTEHLDFLEGQLYIHGHRLWSYNDYMHPAVQVARIRNLVECTPYIRSFLILGDLPRLDGIDQVLPGMGIYRLPFPELGFSDIDMVPGNARGDLLFTGFMTEYRINILGLLRGFGFKVACPKRFVSRNRRNVLNRAAKVVLNIPQCEGWSWLSLMRIIAALRCGRATVSLETQDDSEIAACTYQLPISESDWEDRLRDHIAHWRERFEEALADYQNMSRAFAERHPFPHDMIEFWAVTDRLTKM